MSNRQLTVWWQAAVWSLSLSVCFVSLRTGIAGAQISSNQMKQSYDKHTKGGGSGANIDDSVKLLSNSDPNRRLAAVKSLGASKDDKAVTYLIEALGDTDVRVQAKAVQMLGDLRATDATPVLVQYLFLRTTTADMKQLMLASLGKIGDTRAAKPLMEFLQRDLDTDMRGTVVFALGEIGATEAVDLLQTIAEVDTDQTVRRLASEAKSKVAQHQAVIKSQVKGPAETFLEPKDGSQPKRR